MTLRNLPLRLLALLFFTSTLAVGCRAQQPQSVKAPEFTITDVDGKPFSLAQKKGKIIFLEFWATWCGPCVLSAPEIEKINEDYKAKGVEVLSVSVDEDVTAVKEFIKNRRLTTRVAVSGQSGVDQKYEVSSIPTMFIIDQKGFITAAWGGYHPSYRDQWREELDRLLKT